MKSEQELVEIVNDIMQKLYSEAEPGMDFKEKLKEGPRNDDVPRYKLHYLDGAKQARIANEHIKSLRLSRLEKKRVRSGIHLGKSPHTVLEKVNKKRRELGLDPVKIEKSNDDTVLNGEEVE